MASILALDQRGAAVFWIVDRDSPTEHLLQKYSSQAKRRSSRSPSGTIHHQLMRTVCSVVTPTRGLVRLKYDVANPANETQGGRGEGLCDRPCPHQPHGSDVARKTDLLHANSSMLGVRLHLAFHTDSGRTAAAAPARPSRVVSCRPPSHRHTSPPPLAKPFDTVCVRAPGIGASRSGSGNWRGGAGIVLMVICQKHVPNCQ